MKIIHQKLAEAAEFIADKTTNYKYTPTNVLENENYPTETGRSRWID